MTKLCHCYYTKQFPKKKTDNEHKSNFTQQATDFPINIVRKKSKKNNNSEDADAMTPIS